IFWAACEGAGVVVFFAGACAQTTTPQVATTRAANKLQDRIWRILAASWRTWLIRSAHRSRCLIAGGSAQCPSSRLRNHDPERGRSEIRHGCQGEGRPEAAFLRNRADEERRGRTGQPADVVGEPLGRRADGRGVDLGGDGAEAAE